MDRFFSIIQFVLAIIMFLCALTDAVSYTIMGHITSLLGFIVAFVFIALTWNLVRLSWKELHEANND